MNQTTSFKDLINDGLINTDMLNTLSVSSILFSLFLTFIVALFIHYVYKRTFHGVLYTKSFNDSLILISLVTTMVIMTISTNLILSLGMVGALSIVRFRTAVKDAMDIVFLFWAIGVGIANGAGIFTISIVGSLFLGGVMLIMHKNRTQNKDPYLLIVKYSKDSDRPVWEIIDTIKQNEWACLVVKT